MAPSPSTPHHFRFARAIKSGRLHSVFLLLLLSSWTALAPAAEHAFEGRFFAGRGDEEYLQLLDFSQRLFAPDPEFENVSMLYMPAWNGLVEGPTWDAWWIQNSYGTTYAVLPFLQEPWLTFLQNSQDLWFDQMGDGKRVGAPPPFNWVAPDGCLCDAARPGWIVYKQGDGRTQIHDWGLEFTAAGLLLQSELLLISRDAAAIQKYLPKLERCADFIETRRDPTNNLFLAGPAANLLAPSYAGWQKPDGTYGRAYLTGLSVTYIAALDRLIELEKLAGRTGQAKTQAKRRQAAREGLRRLATDEGYFVRSLDPDGIRHGVYGAARHGYFESSPNHDAIAFNVVDLPQAKRIYAQLASIPGLRPHAFILPNFPSYDDMYEKPEGLWAFGTWVNGGHWSTCEARMVLAYYRLERFEDARRSLRQLRGFAERFRMDNPLTKCGSDVYQPNQPVNLTYDAFGPPAAFVRGLFEYLYSANALSLKPHVPPGITRLEQRFPVRFGSKRLYLATTGAGPVTAVRLNGRPWKKFARDSVLLPYSGLPANATLEIVLGGARPEGFAIDPFADEGRGVDEQVVAPPGSAGASGQTNQFASSSGETEQLRRFCQRLAGRGWGDSYEAAHARLALECMAVTRERAEQLANCRLKPLADAPSQAAAEQLYRDASRKLFDGLSQLMRHYASSIDPRQQAVARLWNP